MGFSRDGIVQTFGNTVWLRKAGCTLAETLYHMVKFFLSFGAQKGVVKLRKARPRPTAFGKGRKIIAEFADENCAQPCGVIHSLFPGHLIVHRTGITFDAEIFPEIFLLEIAVYPPGMIHQIDPCDGKTLG